MQGFLPNAMAVGFTISRDDEEVGVTHKVKSPKNQPRFSQKMMRQDWLGKIKPKQAF